MSFQQKAQPFLQQRKLLDSSKLKLFADDNFEFEENGGKFSQMLQMLWKKEKLLVTSITPFSHSVFKRLVLQTRKTKALFGKRLPG